MKSYGSFYIFPVRPYRTVHRRTVDREKTYVIKGPLDLICEHPVHVRHDLHGHVYEAFGEDEADVIRRRQGIRS